ncbi:MAG: hypothetical protein HC937_03040 [Aquincola sp.]|nr:hypothetical protein [Aquincola sp.]
MRSSEGLARTQVKHYYAQRVLSWSFWSKLISGGVGWRALRGLAGALKTTLSSDSSHTAADSTDFRQRMAQGCARCRPGSVLLVLSGNDYTAKEFADHIERAAEWQTALRTSAAQRCDIADADHTLSLNTARIAVEAATVLWLDELSSRSTGSPAPAQP